MMENSWHYKDQIFDGPIDDLIGFVYLIEDLKSNRKYIGKKLFWFSRKVKVKGSTRKKTQKTESDWKFYYGSNDEMKAEIEKNGVTNFRRTVLFLCKTKGECSYLEAREQFVRNVLLDDSYYNGYIMCRINKSHVKGLMNAT